MTSRAFDAVVNGRPELVDEVGSSQREARGDVVETIAKWLRDADFLNPLERHVEPGRERLVEAPEAHRGASALSAVRTTQRSAGPRDSSLRSRGRTKVQKPVALQVSAYY